MVSVKQRNIKKALEQTIFFLKSQSFVEAKEKANEVIDKDRNNLVAHYFKGLACREMGEFEEAEKGFKKSLMLNSKQYDVTIELGSLQLDMKKFTDANKTFEKALKLNSQGVEALTFKANALMKLKKYDDAMDWTDKALALNPSFDLALWLKSFLLLREEEYVEAYNWALKLKAVNPNMQVLRTIEASYFIHEEKKVHETLPLLEEELRLFPKSPNAALTLSNSYSTIGKIDRAIEVMKKEIENKGDEHAAWSRYLMLHHYKPDAKPEEILKITQSYYDDVLEKQVIAEKEEEGIQDFDFPSFTQKTHFRIGFIAAEFNNHVIYKWLKGFFPSLKELGHEVYCYNIGSEDEYTDQWADGVESMKILSKKTDAEALETIRKDKVDFLFDLTGYLYKNRIKIMAHRAAPIQASWLGQAGPYGVPNYDYMIVDKYMADENKHQKYYNEKLFTMPNYFCAKALPSVFAFPAIAPIMKNDFITFAILNTSVKVNENYLEDVCEIMKEVPNSRLLYKSSIFKSELAKEKFEEFFEKFGITKSRLILEEKSAGTEYYDTYNRIDICLDPYPVGGGTVSHDTLWMSTPYITLMGEHAAHRSSGGALKFLGCSELVANSKEEYKQKVIELAQNPSRIQDYKTSLKDKYLNSSLCDTKGFVKDFDWALKEMWQEKSKAV